MKKTLYLYHILFFIMAFGMVGCGGSSGSDDPSDDDPMDPVQQLPGKANALLPANGEPCSQFEDVNGEADKALIFFEWSSANNANSYLIRVFENGNQVTNNGVSTTETEIVLDRGKTFTWTVTSINNDGETVSDTFSFTSPGVAIGNYAPYAAEVDVIFDIPNLEMDIFWLGNDEDGDTLTYDVTLTQGGIEIDEYIGLNDSSLPTMPYMPDTAYQVEVISRDGNGNFSISVFEFQSPE